MENDEECKVYFNVDWFVGDWNGLECIYFGVYFIEGIGEYIDECFEKVYEYGEYFLGGLVKVFVFGIWEVKFNYFGINEKLYDYIGGNDWIDIEG